MKEKNMWNSKHEGNLRKKAGKLRKWKKVPLTWGEKERALLLSFSDTAAFSIANCRSFSLLVWTAPRFLYLKCLSFFPHSQSPIIFFYFYSSPSAMQKNRMCINLFVCFLFFTKELPTHQEGTVLLHVTVIPFSTSSNHIGVEVRETTPPLCTVPPGRQTCRQTDRQTETRDELSSPSSCVFLRQREWKGTTQRSQVICKLLSSLQAQRFS